MAFTNKDYEKFYFQRSAAKGRGIDWQLTFEDWLSWWQSTGHYHERGRGKGKYVMSRYGDIGPYSLTNIECILGTKNISEAYIHKPRDQSGSNNPMYGKTAWNKDLSKEDQHEYETAVCPHCQRSIAINVIKRWHNDNCKLKA
jgi:hypothetical protein